MLRLSACCLMLFVGGCTHAPALVGGEEVAVRSVAEMPSPASAQPGQVAAVFGVGPLDDLKIDVFGVPDLSREAQVDANGQISMPLIGAVDVAGKTTTQIAHEISDRLKTYVRNPQVTVNLKDSKSRLITVDGAVKDPGLYPVPGTITLMQAIASAHGVSEFARTDEVVVFRTVADKRYAALYNLQAIRQGVYPDPTLYANDKVVVSASRARQVFKDLLQASAGLTAPLVAFIR